MLSKVLKRVEMAFWGFDVLYYLNTEVRWLRQLITRESLDGYYIKYSVLSLTVLKVVNKVTLAV